MVNRLNGKKVIGIKQSIKAINNSEVDKVYIARDADEKLISPVRISAEQKSLEIIYIDTMKELGRLCGIQVGAATVVLLKN